MKNEMRSSILKSTWVTIKTYGRSAVAKNAASLYVIHFADYLLPLITVPYVVRVLSPSGYGLVAFGQGFVGYFNLFIDYGFSLSATRKISVGRHDPAAVSRTVFTIWAAKLLLCFIGFLVLFLLVNLVPTLHQNRALIFLLYGSALGGALFPTWLFLGMERMVNISVINLSIRLLVVVGIFILVKRPEDYIWFAGLNSIGALIAGIVGMIWAFYVFPLSPVCPSCREIFQSLKEGWMLFLSIASLSLYSVGNSFVLGMLTNPAVVGYYSAGEKITRAIQGLVGPITQAAYPRFAKMATDSKALALQWGRRMLFLMGGVGLVLSIIIIATAPLIVKIILGSQYGRSINVLRILAPFPLLVAMSNVLGLQIMLPFGKDRAFTAITFGAGLVNLSLVLVLAPFWQELGMATSVLSAEFVVTVSLFAVLWIYHLNPFATRNAT